MRRVITGLLLVLLVFPSAAARAEGLDVTFHDVGQGLGVSIRTPSGRWVVYDMGPDDASGRGMADDLAARGCTEIAAVVVSHPHADHLGGFGPIFSRFRVREVLEPGVPHTTRTYRDFLSAVDREGCDYRMPVTGDVLTFDSALEITVLHADSAPRNINDGSVVLRIRYNATTLLLTGDAEEGSETRMLARWGARELRADLLQVGHHGSRTSTSPAFLRAVAPETGVISCGTGNRYGHPKPQTLERLARAGVDCARTDLRGTMRYRSDGRRWRPVSQTRPAAAEGDPAGR